ncbi:4-hydroxy-tetrahydrodipicolinate synthase [Sediminispirochaeta smaragdinae]|jgi:4-hydroxy-tetrahydrodipicolinate synthase|uniref:4-hydroxy-tetrahydrodipicolinate synthase n=1 Tax=Sediminispirochaeta smaragdinae (strain DSM 11293 / JCM 15392 / SEBR 4228) TaxID=573413 RepID=E1R554_SEDSS|nr:4-hydroxy-tetrahydrodipicolinate synthase [Sediminispirochaeta smaragdinae]ADK80589.1 dihydrodipicolinate synthase [Sediminispirochaeta smaragdinae DSM 11293]
MERQFRGVYTALITPFTKKGTIDEEAFEKIIEDQIASGIDGLVPCGTTGESPTLSHIEHDRVIELSIKFANGRVPVIAGTGSNATSEAIRLSRHAEEAGASGLLLVNPYYNKPTQKGLYLHFKAVAEVVNIPCIVYNIKGRSGVNVETQTMSKLMEASSMIAGVKEASGNLDQMKDVIAERNSKRKDFSVLSGDDNMTLQLVEAGGDGVVSVASNLIPKRMVEFVHAALDGDMEKARNEEAALMPFFRAMFLETNPIPVKTAMAMQGWCEEEFRLPMCSLSDDTHRETLKQLLERLEVPRG